MRRTRGLRFPVRCLLGGLCGSLGRGPLDSVVWRFGASSRVVSHRPGPIGSRRSTLTKKTPGAPYGWIRPPSATAVAWTGPSCPPKMEKGRHCDHFNTDSSSSLSEGPGLSLGAMPTDEAPLKSIYATASPNTPIVLFDGQGEVSDELHNTAIGSTRVTLDWFPTPRVNFLLESDQDSGIEVGLDYATIKLSNSRTMHGMFTGREISSGGTAGFSEEVRGTAWAEWGRTKRCSTYCSASRISRTSVAQGSKARTPEEGECGPDACSGPVGIGK